MLIRDIVENQANWKGNLQALGRGFGQRLAQRIAPGIDWRSNAAPNPAQPAQPRAVKQPSYAQQAAAVTTQAPMGITPTTATAPVQPTAPVQTMAPAPATAAPAPTPAAKPRVMSQPIRVGNKVYRPGDPMHARLSQMMQAQQQT